jgi:hypothetical protein
MGTSVYKNTMIAVMVAKIGSILIYKMISRVYAYSCALKLEN